VWPISSALSGRIVGRLRCCTALSAAATAAIDRGVEPGRAGDFDLTPAWHYRAVADWEPRTTAGEKIDAGAFEFRAP
jgi:hypothetical protein